MVISKLNAAETMSCFGCCREDDLLGAADYGGHNITKQSGGISVICFSLMEVTNSCF